METWKTIPNYPNFEASSLGRIRRIAGRVRFITKNGKEAMRFRPEKLRKPYINEARGYYYINLTGKTESLHRLVASAFLADYSTELDIDHINGDKLDNRVENLRVATRKQNINNPNTKVFIITRERDRLGRFVKVE